jgi:hypothetical protein
MRGVDEAAGDREQRTPKGDRERRTPTLEPRTPNWTNYP